ncbi:unnamed protein product, partial [Iphiclides podalirius]
MPVNIRTLSEAETYRYLANEQWQDPGVLSVSDREAVWKEKELHGKFYKALHEPFVDTSASLNWLRFGDLFGETEDLSVRYRIRHNLLASILHQELALKYGIVDRKLLYYKYSPEAVLENDRARLYWDRPIITDRTIVANKPDIVVMDWAQSWVFLVDITIPYDENLVKAETDKKTKYLDLAHEVTDILSKHLRRLGLRDGSLQAQIQKAVLLDTARIVRRFLSLSP